MNAPAVVASDLRFAWRPGHPVIDIPQFRLEAGELCFLHGPSGSGKTTLLGLLAGVLEPQSGELQVLGSCMQQLSRARRDQLRGARMGYIFQQFNLLPWLSTLDNITLPCRLQAQRRARLRGESAEQAAQRLCEALGIADLLARPVAEMSVGQQQRVAAARALIGQPELLIADEPTSALDHDHRERFLTLLLEQCRQAGSALLFVSHDRSLASLFHRSVSLGELNRAVRAA
jgi:putative ABC transport system ATP-binding protein